MHFELDAPGNDLIAMNLTIAALDRWIAQQTSELSGEEAGRQIGAMYKEIHLAVDELTPDDDDEEDDEDEDEREEAVDAEHYVAV